MYDGWHLLVYFMFFFNYCYFFLLWIWSSFDEIVVSIQIHTDTQILRKLKNHSWNWGDHSMVMVGSILNLNYSLHCDVIHQLTACQRPILVSYGICCNYIEIWANFRLFFYFVTFFFQIEIQKVKQSRNRKHSENPMRKSNYLNTNSHS